MEWPFIWTSLNPLHPKILCAKYCWNWPNGSQEMIREEMVALYLNKIEYPSPKDALCQVWLNLIQWFLKRRFLKFVNVILLFRCYLPLERGVALHLNKLESLHPGMLCAKFCWNWPFGSGEEENMKSLRRLWRQQTADILWSEKLTWAFGSGELKMIPDSRKNSSSKFNKNIKWFLKQSKADSIIEYWASHHSSWSLEREESRRRTSLQPSFLPPILFSSLTALCFLLLVL